MNDVELCKEEEREWLKEIELCKERKRLKEMELWIGRKKREREWEKEIQPRHSEFKCFIIVILGNNYT